MCNGWNRSAANNMVSKIVGASRGMRLAGNIALPALLVLQCIAPAQAATNQIEENRMDQPTNQATSQQASLSPRQLAIAPIAALAAAGNLPGLHAALEQGLDAGLSISDCKEILVQLYAYAGFPRSLNALGELMQVLQQRQQRGIRDVPGQPAGPVPQGAALLAAGTANQTKLAGAPVQGPLFDFAPAIDVFLKSHLFGDIFGRDNLAWQDRELATVAMLSAISGTDSHLQSHIRISINAGLTPAQLDQFFAALAGQGDPASPQRARAALEHYRQSVPAPESPRS